MPRTVRQIVSGQQLLCTGPDTSVREAAQQMAAKKVGAIMVTGPDGKLLGIFTERDAINRVLALGRNPDATPLSEVMTANLQTIAAEKPLSHALHMMYEGGFRHVPVSEDGKPLGMISARDALGPELAQFENELADRDRLTELII